MLIDNSDRGPAPYQNQPNSFLRHAGLGVVHDRTQMMGSLPYGAAWRGNSDRQSGPSTFAGWRHEQLDGWRHEQLDGLGDDVTGTGTVITSGDIQTAITGLNSEALYLLNLARANQGLPALPASYNPGVNVGLSTTAMVGIAVLAYALLKR